MRARVYLAVVSLALFHATGVGYAHSAELICGEKQLLDFAVPNTFPGVPIGPLVGIDGAGNITAAWGYEFSDPGQLYASRYDIATGWGSKTALDTGPDLPRIHLPTLDTNASGAALLAWSGQSGLYAKAFVPGSGWGQTATVLSAPSPFLTFANQPRVAIDSAGNGLLVWANDNGDALYSSRYIVGSGWSTPEVIGNRGFANGRISLAMNPTGNAVLLWEHWSGSTWTLNASTFTAGTGWQAPAVLYSSTIYHWPHVAINAQGIAMAVWVDSGTSFPESTLYAAKYIPGQGWQSPELVSNTSRPADPRVDIDSVGTAIVVWRTAYDLTVSVNRYLNGTGWQGITVLKQYLVGDPLYPRVKMDGQGNAIATWESPMVPSTTEIRRFQPADGWQEFNLVGPSRGATELVSLALNADGQTVAAWSDRYTVFDGQFFNTFTDLYASRFSMLCPSVTGDTTPDIFSFTAQNNVAINAIVTSNTISVSGINAPTAVGIAGGEYSINGGVFTDAPGMVANGDSVTVRVAAPSSYSTTVTATLSVGGVNAGFSVTTTFDPSTLWAAAGYAPLPDNATWSYLRDGASYTTTILPGTVFFNTLEVKQAQNSDDGTINYYTNDVNGILEHGYFTPSVFISGYGYTTETLVFSPPVKVTDAQFSLGQNFTNSGTATLSWGGIGAFSLSYTSTSTPAAFETITVPAGTFNALRVDQYLRIFGSIEGDIMDVTGQGSTWVVNGLGPIKAVITTNDGTGLTTSNEVLTASSLLDASPAPFSFAALSNVAPGALVTSNAMIVEGINAGASISVTGGEYSIDGGPWTSGTGVVFNGQSVAVRQTSSSSNNTMTCATLTIGGVAGSFCATTVAGAPTGPTAVSATAGIGSITVNFAAPASNGGTAIIGYTATCTSSDGGVPRSNTGSATATSIRVGGLTNGTRYTCTVTASNAAGAGEVSAPSRAVAPVDITPILNLLLED